MLRRTFDAEVVHLGAESEHEVVVRKRFHIREPNLALLEIDARGRSFVDPRVRLLVEEIAKCMADCGRRKQVGRDLVEEWLEGVVVVLVDEDDVDVHVFQLPRGPDPGESSAEDDHARTGRPSRLAHTKSISASPQRCRRRNRFHPGEIAETSALPLP